MKKISIALIIVLIILIAGIGFLTASLYNSHSFSANNSNINANKNEIKSNEMINQQNIDEDSCTIYNSNYPCFDYEEVKQERGNGNLEIVEQLKQQPCEKPKIVCKKCLQPLEQEKGDGDLDILEQVRENC